MDQTTKITDLIKIIANQLSGKVDDDTEDLIPEYTIRGTGDIFCYNLTEKMFSKICRGSMVFVLREDFNNTGRTLIYTYLNELILIDPEELVYIGYD